MKYIIDNDLHIHSYLSLCSDDPEQTPRRILRYAQENGLKTICLTDHYWHSENIPCSNDWYKKQNLAHIKQALPLPQAEGISFLFGCETELSADFTLGIDDSDLEFFDFIVIPTTHFHIRPFAVKDEDFRDEHARADIWYARFEAVLDMDLPFEKTGIAHLACSAIGKDYEDYMKTLDALDEKEMRRLFSKAASKGVGIEINSDDVNYCKKEDGDRAMRMFRIAKECGCKFYLGSDAHHPKILDCAKERFIKAVDALKLTENDKFRPEIP